METPRQIADNLMQVARQIYVDTYTGDADEPTVMPQVLGFKGTDFAPLSPDIVHDLFANDAGKKMLGTLIDTALQTDKFDMVAVISETFFIERRGEDDIEGPPSEQPDRKQAIMIQVSAKGVLLSLMQNIADGKLVGEPYTLEGEVSGNLVPPSATEKGIIQ